MSTELGSIVGRALVRGGHATNLSALLHVVEFKRKGDELEDWTKWDNVVGSFGSGSGSGLAGKVVTQARTGKRLAEDLYEVMSGRGRGGAAPSQNVGGFKVTENSPNTIRVTAGGDRRQRRKKYEWERAETRRKIEKYVVGGVGVGAATAALAIAKRGGGSFTKGAQVLTKDAVGGTKQVAKGLVDVLKGKGWTYKRQRNTSVAQSKVDEMLKKSAKRKGYPEGFTVEK